MSRHYYKGSDPLRYSVYRRAVEAYSRHIFYCAECRGYLAALNELAARPLVETRAQWEAWEKELADVIQGTQRQ